MRGRGTLSGIAACAAVLAGAPAAAARDWTVSSPSGTLATTVAATADAVTLAVHRGARTLLSARLPVSAAPRGPLPARRGTLVEGFATPAGKRRRHDLRANTLIVRLGGGHRVELLAADDGIAVRGSRAGAPTWRGAAGATAWLQRFARAYENAYAATPLATAAPGAYGFPALLGEGAGSWALLGESGLSGAEGGARLRLRPADPGALAVRAAGGEPARGWSPWRFAIVGGLGTIVGSELPLVLGRPSRIADTGWIRPGRAAWSWWSDPASPASADRQRQYVDFAARQGFEYVTVDAGWSDADMPALGAYAAQRGVRLLLWTDWHALADPAQRAALLDRWAAWGIAGVKVDFLGGDGRGRMALYDAIAGDAAARRLVVDFHGCTVPRGIQRTWPNVLTMEAVRGAEHARDGEPVDAADDVDLAFTRNVVGSMDYTPALGAPGATLGHELALAALYESGIVTFAGTPEAYAAQPAALDVMRALPAAWDDVRVLGGRPDDSVTLARRAGETWWVASAAAAAAATRRVRLDFLPPGAAYTATVTADDGAGGLTAWTRVVTVQDALAVDVPARGGFVVRLAPV